MLVDLANIGVHHIMVYPIVSKGPPVHYNLFGPWSFQVVKMVSKGPYSVQICLYLGGFNLPQLLRQLMNVYNLVDKSETVLPHGN